MIDVDAAAQTPSHARSRLAFLQGGGEMGALIRSFDWEASSLGPPSSWPSSLQIALNLLLKARQPMYIWWGPRLLCFYNDAYRQSIGPELHPGSLGQPGRETWAEIWDTIGPQIEEVLATGESVSRQDALVPITRNGRREEVYWTYSYNPLFDPAAPNHLGGVLVICSETTQKVLADRRTAGELRNLASLFEQAPTFMALLMGPDHRFSYVNPTYRQLIGTRDVIGRTVAEALPESINQGYVEILDRVYQSGQPFTATRMKFALEPLQGALPVDRYLDFVYQPMKDDKGVVTEFSSSESMPPNAM